MDQKSLARWLKCILVGVGLCGIVVYAVVVPSLGLSLAREYPEFGYCFWPWLIFILATGLPCYAALFLAWKVASNIGRERSFSTETARLFRMISWACSRVSRLRSPPRRCPTSFKRPPLCRSRAT